MRVVGVVAIAVVFSGCDQKMANNVLKFAQKDDVERIMTRYYKDVLGQDVSKFAAGSDERKTFDTHVLGFHGILTFNGSEYNIYKDHHVTLKTSEDALLEFMKTLVNGPSVTVTVSTSSTGTQPGSLQPANGALPAPPNVSGATTTPAPTTTVASAGKTTTTKAPKKKTDKQLKQEAENAKVMKDVETARNTLLATMVATARKNSGQVPSIPTELVSMFDLFKNIPATQQSIIVTTLKQQIPYLIQSTTSSTPVETTTTTTTTTGGFPIGNTAAFQYNPTYAGGLQSPTSTLFVNNETGGNNLLQKDHVVPPFVLKPVVTGVPTNVGVVSAVPQQTTLITTGGGMTSGVPQQTILSTSGSTSATSGVPQQTTVVSTTGTGATSATAAVPQQTIVSTSATTGATSVVPQQTVITTNPTTGGVPQQTVITTNPTTGGVPQQTVITTNPTTGVVPQQTVISTASQVVQQGGMAGFAMSPSLMVSTPVVQSLQLYVLPKNSQASEQLANILNKMGRLRIARQKNINHLADAERILSDAPATTDSFQQYAQYRALITSEQNQIEVALAALMQEFESSGGFSITITPDGTTGKNTVTVEPPVNHLQEIEVMKDGILQAQSAMKLAYQQYNTMQAQVGTMKDRLAYLQARLNSLANDSAERPQVVAEVEKMQREVQEAQAQAQAVSARAVNFENAAKALVEEISKKAVSSPAAQSEFVHASNGAKVILNSAGKVEGIESGPKEYGNYVVTSHADGSQVVSATNLATRKSENILRIPPRQQPVSVVEDPKAALAKAERHALNEVQVAQNQLRDLSAQLQAARAESEAVEAKKNDLMQAAASNADDAAVLASLQKAIAGQERAIAEKATRMASLQAAIADAQRKEQKAREEAEEFLRKQREVNLQAQVAAEEERMREELAQLQKMKDLKEQTDLIIEARELQTRQLQEQLRRVGADTETEESKELKRAIEEQEQILDQLTRRSGALRADIAQKNVEILNTNKAIEAKKQRAQTENPKPRIVERQNPIFDRPIIEERPRPRIEERPRPRIEEEKPGFAFPTQAEQERKAREAQLAQEDAVREAARLERQKRLLIEETEAARKVEAELAERRAKIGADQTAELAANRQAIAAQEAQNAARMKHLAELDAQIRVQREREERARAIRQETEATARALQEQRERNAQLQKEADRLALEAAAREEKARREKAAQDQRLAELKEKAAQDQRDLERLEEEAARLEAEQKRRNFDLGKQDEQVPPQRGDMRRGSLGGETNGFPQFERPRRASETFPFDRNADEVPQLNGFGEKPPAPFKFQDDVLTYIRNNSSLKLPGVDDEERKEQPNNVERPNNEERPNNLERPQPNNEERPNNLERPQPNNFERPQPNNFERPQPNEEKKEQPAPKKENDEELD